MSQSNKFRLPEVGQLHPTGAPVKPSHSIIRPSKGHKVISRPRYVSKKVSAEEILVDPFRISNFVGLSQINEENTGEVDELFRPQMSMEFNEPKNEIVNIFKAEIIDSSKFQEAIKGPVYKDGQIIKHSIVGTPDTYEKHQRLASRSLKERVGLIEKESFIDEDTSRNPSQSHPGPRPERPDTTPSSYDYWDVWSHRASSRRLTAFSEIRKPIVRNSSLTKEEAREEISKIKERQSSACRESDRSISFIDQQYFVKEEKCLSKFQQTVNQWQRTIENITKKVGRDEGSSVMLTTQDHREKKEMAEMFDFIKTDEERYGSKIWYKTLRKPSESKIDKMNSILGLTPAPSQKDLTDSEERRTPIEFIRKPRAIKTPIEMRRLTERRIGRTEREYIDSRLTARKSVVEEIRPTPTEQISELMVQGKNKLDLEAEILMKEFDKGKRAVLIPKNYFQRQRPVHPEEIIERRRNKSEILRHGVGVFVK